jgi:hydroxymethylpyrimidine pyrophosphatase-like HAD family hydrolase
MSKSLFIGIDFDGTVVKHAYPEIGEPLEGAIETLAALNKAGHKLILYTMRSGERLVQAREYLEENGIELWAVNENPSQKHWTESPKIFCNLYIDDAALGIPLLGDVNDDGVISGRPYVCWESVEILLKQRGVIW